MCEDYSLERNPRSEWHSSIPLPWIYHNKPAWKQGWLAMTSWLLHFNGKPTTLGSNWSLIIGFPVMWSKETATGNNVWKHVKSRFPEKKLCFAKQRSLFSIFIDSRCSSYHIKNIPKLGGGFWIFFIFTPTWGDDPISLICFRWVETTNKKNQIL